MSTASASRTIGYVTRGGSYTARIVCNKGDFFQEFDDAGSVYPAYPSMSPKCRLWLSVDTSLGGANTPLVSNSLAVEINGSALSFGTDGEDQSYHMFKHVAATSTTPEMIEVIANPAEAYGQASFTFTLKANAYANGVSFPVSATGTCRISKSSGAGIIATIYEEEASGSYTPCNFQITDPNQTVKLRCRAGGLGQGELSGAYYRWLMQDPDEEGGWRQIKAKNIDAMVSITQEEVVGYMCVKCEVYGKQADTVPIATDQQGIWDAQDPEVVEPGPDTDDLVFYDTDAADKAITFRPYVTDLARTTVNTSYNWYKFSVINSVGSIMNGDYNTVYTIAPGSTSGGFKVYAESAQQNEGPIDLVITAYSTNPSAS